MFTGIIESTGLIHSITENGANKTFIIQSNLAKELKVDQSVAHSGVCLTVEAVREDCHQVTAIQETLSKTTLSVWKKGDIVNLEQCLKWNGRLDGHLVQGHVDCTAACTHRIEQNGSWLYSFQIHEKFAHLIIEKGSICVDGISLTVFDVGHRDFSVAIIPYTFEHTNISKTVAGSEVNIEFDVIGKYFSRYTEIFKRK